MEDYQDLMETYKQIGTQLPTLPNELTENQNENEENDIAEENSESKSKEKEKEKIEKLPLKETLENFKKENPKLYKLIQGILSKPKPKKVDNTTNYPLITTVTGRHVYECKLCGTKIASKSGYRNHMVIHSDKIPFRCHICGKGFLRKNNLNQHFKSHNRDKTVRSYPCPLCGKVYTQLGYLAVHYRTHTGEKPFICDICDEQFLLKAQLNKHLQTHTGLTAYMQYT